MYNINGENANLVYLIRRYYVRIRKGYPPVHNSKSSVETSHCDISTGKIVIRIDHAQSVRCRAVRLYPINDRHP